VVAQLRRVLGDEAREARYIETVPTRGYRWIRPVEEALQLAHVPAAPLPAPEPVEPVPAATPSRVVSSVAAGIVLTALVSALVVVWTQRGTLTSATGGAARAAGTLAAGDPRHGDMKWPVQVTTHGGLDLHPALSPPGDAVAYVSDRTGGLEIYVRALGGTGTDSALTSDGGQNVQPAWSPDAQFIAYHSYRSGGIWVVPARGGLARQVAATGSHPAWSPDGRRIVFQSDEHADVTPMAWGAQSGSTIWMVDADGGNLREVTRAGHPTGGHAAPAWSHDGRFLAFTVFEGGPGNGVWILPLDTGELRFLEGGKGLYELVFAPDGSALYVAGGEALIVRLPFDSSTGAMRGARELIPVPGVPGVRGLSISADGQRLAFAGMALSSQIWAQQLTPDGFAVGPPKPLTSDTSRRNSMPMVSPDGSRVAYVSTRSGEPPNIWVMSVEGREPMQVTADETAEYSPSWFPKGDRIGYMSDRGGRYALWSVDIATRREELFFEPPDNRVRHSALGQPAGRLAEMQLAPSVTRAAFSVIPPPGRRVMYVTDLDRFAPRRLTDGTASVGYPAWSPDERRLAVEVKDGSSTHAAVIDVQSGIMQPLTNERGQTWVSSWSPDGTKVAAAVLRDGAWSLRWIDVADGRQGIITPPGPPHLYVRYPEWSPRGTLIVFERGELRGNIWTLALR
jgi:Tol biopolymer transport system component